ncbi:hypothetical protein MY4038_009771 [Beauveria bassiana]
MSSAARIQASTPLDLIIDNDTRWLSQLYMIRRAIVLRPFLEQLILKHRQQWEQENRSKRTGGARKSAKEPRICMEENQLTSSDWIVLEHLAKLLGFYEDAVRTLEGDGQLPGLAQVLQKYKQLACGTPDSEHLRININLGWEKLNKYYRLLDETPIYCTALALPPAFRWGYFENEWKDHSDWVVNAKQTVREVWETQYRRLRIVPGRLAERPAAKRQKKYYNPFQAYCERTRSMPGPSVAKEELTGSRCFDGTDDVDDVVDELELWQSLWEGGDSDVRDPLEYWHECRRRYPRLSRMALEFLTIQAMSAEYERLFSAAGRMVTPLRSRLDADIIGMCQVLRSWLREGVIKDLDVLLVPPDRCGDAADVGSEGKEEEDER